MPFFETTTTTVNKTVGAVYNSLDFNPSSLMKFKPRVSTTIVQPENLSGDLSLHVIPQTVVDNTVLSADHYNKSRYEFQSRLFDKDSPIDSTIYLDKVTALVGGEWRRLDIRKEDFARFNSRYRKGWVGTDSVYDAYLISLGLQRRCFPYEKFRNLNLNWEPMFEDWEKELEQRVTEVDCSNVDVKPQVENTRFIQNVHIDHVLEISSSDSETDVDIVVVTSNNEISTVEAKPQVKFRPNYKVTHVVTLSSDSEKEEPIPKKLRFTQ